MIDRVVRIKTIQERFDELQRDNFNLKWENDKLRAEVERQKELMQRLAEVFGVARIGELNPESEST